jgi:hypothetical protein
MQSAAILPPLAELARANFAFRNAKHAFDRAVVESKDNTPAHRIAEAAFDRAEATSLALHDLALMLPVRNLADAAAWSLVCFAELDVLRNSEAAWDAVLSDRLDAIFRGIAGVAIVLAKAVGQDLSETNDPDTIELLRLHAGVELTQ